jgi:uncharacterized protein (TIRG00374 family)
VSRPDAALRNFLFKWVFSTVLGAVLLWLAFRGEDWSDFFVRLEKVDVSLLWTYGLLFAISHVVRIVRWGVLVRALGPIHWRDIVSAGAIGYLCITVFPLRLGELVRPYLVRGKGGVSGTGALATVVVERVIDGVLFVALFFVFISFLPPNGNPKVDAVKLSGYVAGAVFLGALLVLIGGYVRRQATVELIRSIGNRIHAGTTVRVVRVLDAFLDGLKILPDKRRILWFVVLTILYWAIQGVGMKIMGDAVNIRDLSYPGGFALLAILVVGIMIPGGPGMTGTFELALAAGFSLLLLSPESQGNITLYTIMLHVVQLVVQVIVGLPYLILPHARLSGAVTVADDPDGPDAPEGNPPPNR